MELLQALCDLPVPKNERKTWAARPAVIEAHRIGVHEFISRIPPRPDFHGRGIVIAAGGVDYFINAWVCASVLRGLGCSLPIEFWHLGAAEADPAMKRLTQELSVTWVDAKQVASRLPQYPRILAGWELKPFAILHSRFEEVLYLDADNISVRDPAYLFSEPEYLKTGAIFWPDLPPPAPRTEWVPHAAWYSVGLEYLPNRALESGQLLINKSKCWSAINLANWICEHSDRYFEVIYGDKDSFLLAWHRTNTPYAITDTPAGTCIVGILQYDLHGQLAFIHRCQDKWRYRGRNGHTGSAAETIGHTALDRLRKLWHGNIWAWSDQSENEHFLAKDISGLYSYNRVGLGTRDLMLTNNGGIALGTAECERYWTLRILDEPTLIIVGRGKATMLLKFRDNAWRGRWEEYEQCDVFLERKSA